MIIFYSFLILNMILASKLLYYNFEKFVEIIILFHVFFY